MEFDRYLIRQRLELIKMVLLDGANQQRRRKR